MGLPIALQDDLPPYLNFKHDTIEDRLKTNETGRYSVKDVEVVEITPRGDPKSMAIMQVPEFLQQMRDRLRLGQISKAHHDYVFRAYDEWKDKGVMPIEGTPILGWTLASPGQQKAILDANIKSVEDLASCTAGALEAIGMGAQELKRKAQNWVAQAEGPGKVVAQMAQMQAELESLREREIERNDVVKQLQGEIDRLRKKEKEK